MRIFRKALAPVLVLGIGFGAGAISGVRTRTVTETRTVTRVGLPVDCVRALTLAGDGLGFAQQAMALGRQAVQAAAAPASSSSGGRSSPPAAPSTTGTAGTAHAPSDALFGEGMSRLLFAQRQYLEARSACDAAVTRQQPGAGGAAPETTRAPSSTDR